MIFPSNFEQKLGFNLIRGMLQGDCLGPLGKQNVDAITFTSDLQTVQKQLFQTEEFRNILLSEESFPSQDYYDMIPEILRLRIEGTYMEPGLLSELKLSLSSILQILSFFSSRSEEKYPYLHSLTRDITIDKTIIKRLEKIIDEKANVKDDASPSLKKIRKEKLARQAVVEKKIAQNLKKAIRSGWTPDDAGITVRDGRLVIPLLAKYKRQLTGFIHDESATGQTVYIEPADVLETNNEIRELEHAERREIIRILIEFADFLRPYHSDLVKAYHFLGMIDFIRAKAMLALKINAGMPKKITGNPLIKWVEAIHPLLYLSHSRQKKSVVPLTISLDGSKRILVISGPNAGGKSVCLKTVGLLQYMIQCGLLPSVKEDSEFGIFNKLFIDIGDEQSLENDLSTYTSRLLNIKFFIENLDDRSLFLIDEFGTGTDPSLGGAIAEASLQQMNEEEAFGVITTHYSNLKLLAGKIPGIVNAAMLFDSKKMQPLYKLKMGKPGSSFAFEIARQIGFPENVLESASSRTGKSQLDFDKQLQDLEVEKTELAKKSTELQVADDFLHELISKYQKMHDELEKSKKEILLKAREEALQLFNESNKTIEKTIREIRESQADKARTLVAREELKRQKEKVENMPYAPGKKLQPADDKKTHTLPDPLSQPLTKPETRSPYKSFLDDINRKLQDFQLILDIRGKRADESHSLLQRYIDDAIMLSIPEVRILHGKGNGILRQVTRDYLSTVKEVKKFQDENTERGGAGVTVITFR